ncbi:hypothetical protein [Clostridium saccharobutylicum]|uniref:hypothetical protein n=1 Tax=Clostridium saccharobutylicum TaxID=169679 RepID=UPI0015FC0250|nr:DNA mismatch repair ATPase MutL [Clostridium saccharobutylicum]
MCTIHKINKKYILTMLLTVIFALSSLPLDIFSVTGISPTNSICAYAKSSSSSGSHSSSSSSSSSKSSSGFKSGSVSSNSSGSDTNSSKNSTSSKSGEGFKSGSFSNSNSSNSSTNSHSSSSSSSDGASKGFSSGSYSSTDKNKTADSTNSSDTNTNQDNNSHTYKNSSGGSPFWGFFGVGGNSFYRPSYFGSFPSMLMKTIVMAGIFILIIILIKIYLNKKRK